jgi:lysophospholipase L1-like esterase
MRLNTRTILYLLVLLSPWPVFAAECSAPPTTAVTTTQNVRRGHDVRFRARLQEIETKLTGGAFDVLVLGDSIIQQWPQEALDKAFPGRRVLNAGVSGDGSAALLHRLSSARIPAVVDGQPVQLGIAGWERQRPAQVLVLIGTNDLDRAPPCDVALGVQAVAARVRQLYPAAAVAVLSVLPRGPTQAEFADRIEAVNAAVDAAAAAGHFRFINAHRALLCPAGATCAVTRPPNHVHLTPAGYELLGQSVRQGLGAR